MGMGFGMAQQMGQMMSGAQQQQPSSGVSASGGGPPPIPSQQPAAPEWFAAYGGQQSGPLSLGVLKDDVRAGKLTRDTLVWRKGMGQWTKAGEVQELSDLISELPPPLPG
jgi:hypothetical protein